MACGGSSASTGPEGTAHLESIGERTLRYEGRSRTVRLFVVHGLDPFPLCVWLGEDATAFADDWSIREGREAASPARPAPCHSVRQPELALCKF